MGIADASFGIGLRQPHYREVFERRPALGFVEVHSENFFLDGGASMHALERARSAYPVSLHGVGLALGSADASLHVGAQSMASTHLAALKRLVERIEPAQVSEHLCWGTVAGRHFNDLLPMPLTHAALALMAERVDRVQTVLKRPILIENVSAYVAFSHADMTELGLLAELARRTGCRLLLDLNNLYVNARNFGFDAHADLQELDTAAIGQIHLAGHTAVDDCLIDTHSARVCDDVWALYEAACRRFGPKPTLIEWDNDLPPLAVLLDEAARALAVAERAVKSAEAAQPAHCVPAAT